MINEVLRVFVRVKHRKLAEPTAGDSQLVTNTRSRCAEKDFDSKKKVKDCKKHVDEDALGLLLIVVIPCAPQHDSKAIKVFEKLNENFYTLKKYL